MLTTTSTEPITRHLEYDFRKKSFSVIIKNEGEQLRFIRKFMVKRGIPQVIHEYFQLPKEYQRGGLAKDVFQSSLRAYTEGTIRYIHVDAGLAMGGYVWARHGFVAVDKKEVTLKTFMTAIIPAIPVERPFQ